MLARPLGELPTESGERAQRSRPTQNSFFIFFLPSPSRFRVPPLPEDEAFFTSARAETSLCVSRTSLHRQMKLHFPRSGKLHCGASRRYAPSLSPRGILFDENSDLNPVLDLALFTVGFHPRFAHDMERAVEGIVEETQVSYRALDRLFSTAPHPF